MNTKRPYEKLFCYLVLPATLFMLQGCDGISGPTPKEPLVIQFDFQTPVQATVAQKLKFLDALNRYSVPESTKILADGHQIYPFVPGKGEGATLKTESVVSAGDNGEAGTGATVNTRTSNNHGFIKDTRTSNNPAAVVHTRTSNNNPSTRVTRSQTEEFVASAAKTRSSQCIAFKNQQDMKAFLRVIESR